MTRAALACLCAAALAAGCASVPTLAQRADAWRRHVDVQRATCLVGLQDPAMPADVREWCGRVAE